MVKEYGRKPYLSDDYADMMSDITQKSVQDIELYKQSEFDKPYKSPSYEEMEQYYPDWNPYDYGGNFDYPGMPVEGMPHSAEAGEKVKGGTTTVNRCNCEKIELNYTTRQMQVGGTQSLSVGGLNSLCDEENITWSLAGEGSLLKRTGFSNLYTAPDSNANCAGNAVITVSCGSSDDSVNIAINAVTGLVIAAFVYQDVCDTCILSGVWPQCAPGTVSGVGYHYGACCERRYYCDGTEYLTGYTCVMWDSSCGDRAKFCEVCKGMGACPNGTEVIDMRSEANKVAGCCPVAFL